MPNASKQNLESSKAKPKDHLFFSTNMPAKAMFSNFPSQRLLRKPKMSGREIVYAHRKENIKNVKIIY